MKKNYLRIKNISKYIPPYNKIADVGCDHGYLIIDAFDNYDINFAQAIDNKSGPLNHCIQNLKETPYYRNVSFSLSDGISELNEEVEVVVIAGMGGLLVKNIVSSHLDKLNNVKRIIVQPNRDSYEVRKYLTSIGYDIKGETIVYEDKKYYEIICFDKVNYQIREYSEVELQYGPLNLKKRRKEFIEYLQSILKKLSLIPFEGEKLKKEKNQLKAIINNENK